MIVHVLFFAYLRDVTRTPALDLALPDGARVADAHAAVVAKWPDLESQLVRIPVVVDGKLADAAAPLRDGAEMAWLPPVGGGAGEGAELPGAVLVAVTSAPLDLARLVSAVSAPSCGAVASFLGVVRDHDEGRRVLALEYQAYESVAADQLRGVVKEALARWPAARVAVVHRTGRLVVGDASVAIAAACPHRAEAFACCRFVIDRVKEAVPIWKGEYGPSDAAPRWLPGHDWRPAGDDAGDAEPR